MAIYIFRNNNTQKNTTTSNFRMDEFKCISMNVKKIEQITWKKKAAKSEPAEEVVRENLGFWEMCALTKILHNHLSAYAQKSNAIKSVFMSFIIHKN